MPLFHYISVIIPTYNRPEKLACCLGALVQQEYPKNCFEVIVVDDGSTVSSGTIIEQFKKSIKLTFLNQTNAGPATARNHGASHAKGDFLFFIDDDCLPSKNWLDVFSSCLKKMPQCIVGGKINSNASSNIYEVTSQLILDLVYSHYNHNHHQASFVSSCNMGVSKELFLKLNGFDFRFRTSEDRELCSRWRLNGYSVIYVPEAAVLHNDYVNSLASFCHRYLAYGRGAYRFHNSISVNAPDSIKNLQSFYFPLKNWLFYPFKNGKGLRAFGSSFLLLIWQLCNLVGFLREAIIHHSNRTKSPNKPAH